MVGRRGVDELLLLIICIIGLCIAQCPLYLDCQSCTSNPKWVLQQVHFFVFLPKKTICFWRCGWCGKPGLCLGKEKSFDLLILFEKFFIYKQIQLFHQIHSAMGLNYQEIPFARHFSTINSRKIVPNVHQLFATLFQIALHAINWMRKIIADGVKSREYLLVAF